MIRILRDGELLLSHPNFASQFLKRSMNNRNRLQVLSNVLYRQYFDHAGKPTSKQIEVPDTMIDDKIRTLHWNPMQVNAGASKILKVLRSRYYALDLTRKLQDYIDNCHQMCIQDKPCSNTKFPPPLEQIYDAFNGSQYIIQIDLVGELPVSNGYTHILTTWKFFLRYFFAVQTRQPSTSAVAHAFDKFFLNTHLSRNIYWMTKNPQLPLKSWQNSWVILASRSITPHS